MTDGTETKVADLPALGQSIWLDGNDLRIILCDNDGASSTFSYYYYELDNSDNEVDVGDGTVTTANECYAIDIFVIGSTVYALIIDDKDNGNIEIWDVTSAPFSIADSSALDDVAGEFLYGVVIPSGTGFEYWFGFDYVDLDYIQTYYFSYPGEAVVFRWNIADPATSDPGNVNQRTITYDEGNGYLYLTVKKDADGLVYLYQIDDDGGGGVTEMGQVGFAIQISRNNSGTAPNEQEWGFAIAKDGNNQSRIYQFKPNGRKAYFQYQTITVNANVSGITDNYCWDSAGNIYILTNIAEDVITEPEYNDGVFPILKFARWIVHPSNEEFWELEDSIKWYDDSDNEEFWGRITGKDKTKDGLYKFAAAASSNEWMERVYEKSYSSDGSDDKYNAAMDNLLDFCYNPNSFFGAPDNFNDETVGTSGTDISFVDAATLHDGACEIVASYQSHNKLLRLQDDATAGEDPSITHNLTQATADIVEFWIATNDVTERWVFTLRESGTSIIRLLITASQLQWYDGADWHEVQAVSNDTWYHIKVQWYADNTFDLYGNYSQLVDGEDCEDDQVSGIDNFTVFCLGDSTDYLYLDAWGECSNANYGAGDNVNLWWCDTDYNYELKQPIATISSLGRWLDRQVIYAKPDCRIYSRPYDTLPSSGLSWNVETSGGLFWTPISRRDERAYIKSSLNVTRVYVRYASGRSHHPATLPSATELATGIHEAREYKDLRLDATTAAALDDQYYAILNVETQYCSLLAVGKGRVDPGSTITFQDTGDMGITSFTAMVLNFIRDPKADEYKQIILTDNILYPADFFSKGAKPQQQVEQNAVDIYETRNAYSRIYASAGDPTVNDDVDLGYKTGDIWINTGDAGVFICIDNSDGAADWDELAKA